MFWPYFFGSCITAASIVGLIVLILLWRRRKKVGQRVSLLTFILGLAPVVFLLGTFVWSESRQLFFRSQWNRVEIGMSLREVENILGSPNKVWESGEIIWTETTASEAGSYTLTLWEYHTPRHRCILQVSKPPFIRFRCGIDDLDLGWRPRKGRPCLEISEEGRVIRNSLGI